MKRRKFLKKSAPVVASLPILSSFAFSSGLKAIQENKENSLFFKLSLAQWSLNKAVRAGESPYDFADRAKKMGFAGLEYVTQLYRDVIDSKDQLPAIKKFISKSNKKAEENGLKNLLLMVDHEGELASKEATKRAESVDLHKKWVDAAVAMDCHSIRVNLFGEKDATADEWKENAIKGLSKLADYGAGQNINIIVENHGGYSSNAGLLMEVINGINKDNCGTLPDFGNFCVRRKDNERWGAKCVEEYDRYKGVEELMPKAFAVSAKSNDFDKEGNEIHTDYVRMLQLVKDSGYTGFIGVEYEGSKLSEEEGIIATRDLLIAVGKKVK